MAHYIVNIALVAKMKMNKIDVLRGRDNVKHIKNAIWFIRESKKFTGYGYFRMLFKENLIKKTIWFVKEMNE